MSGGGMETQQQSSQMNPELRPLYGDTANLIRNMQNGLVDTNIFWEMGQPQTQQIPGLTPEQQAITGTQFNRAMSPWETGYDVAGTNVAGSLGQMRLPEQYAFNASQNLGGMQAPESSAIQNSQNFGTLRAPEYQALNQIGYFTGGELGQSPATQAAMRAVRNPVLNDLGLAGLGNSGAVETELSAAYSPILAQEMALRSGAINQLSALGAQQRGGDIQAAQLQSEIGGRLRQGGLAGAQLQAQIGEALRRGDTATAQWLQQQGQIMTQRGSGLLSEAFQGAEAGRGIAEAQGEAEYKDFLRRQGIASEYSTGVLGGIPSTLGSRTTMSGGGK